MKEWIVELARRLLARRDAASGAQLGDPCETDTTQDYRFLSALNGTLVLFNSALSPQHSELMMMQLRNTTSSFGLPAVLIHWITALAVLFMFGLGVWMRTLDYYSPWYQTAPDLHKSIGLLLMVLTLARVGWMLINPHPAPPPHSPKWERAGARLVHLLLYALLFSAMICGYLISTADGRPIPLFGLADVPALPWAFEYQEEVAGKLHRWLAYSLIGLVALHALAALKHHFIDRDDTLRRITLGFLRTP